MNHSALNTCRYFISVARTTLFLFALSVQAQTDCISTVATACAGECHPVTYVGNKSPNASYNWTISCGTISNPTLQNPHIACFNNPGICTIQLIVQEPGQAPETCVVEVVVFPVPEATMTLSKDTLCLGDCFTLNLKLIGTPPFTFQILENNVPNNYSSPTNIFSKQFCPSVTTQYVLRYLADQNCVDSTGVYSDTVVVLPPFIGSIFQSNNILCALPSQSSIKYEWYECGGNSILSTQACFGPSKDGCYCVVLDNGHCRDTVCKDFFCDLVCSFDFPDTICVGDTALIYYTGNGGPNTLFDWTLDIDNFIGLHFTGQDSLWIKYTLPGCYPIRLNVREANCTNSCSDTICVISKPCVCDTFNKNQLIPNANGKPCCYEVTGDISSYNCFTSIQLTVSDGSFALIQSNLSAGWSVQSISTRELLFTHSSGFIPPGYFNAGSFCVANANQYTVSVRYLKPGPAHQDSCTYNYVFNCPPPAGAGYCDSLTSFLEKQHTLPSACCYNIHSQLLLPFTFNQIRININSGNFSSITANSSQGFYLVSSSSQDFVIAHTSGFIPQGSWLPASYCISNAINPIALDLVYYYSAGGIKDSCRYNFVFDCPGFNPVPDCCDSTSMQLLPYGIQPNCCYDVHASSTQSKCFSQICFKTNSGSFSNVIANPGWTALITPQGFCFIPVSTIFPSGPINPGSFCVSGATNPFTITADFYDTQGAILDSCKKTFVRDCPPPPKVCGCDSLVSNVSSLSTNPGICCYAMQANVPVNNCFTQIGVQLSSGAFTNISASTGWTSTSNGLQSFTLVHSSGFVPTGGINPATFCVTGSTFYTVTLHYVFITNGKRDTCSFQYHFDCPPVPKVCNCDSLTNLVVQTSAVPGKCCYNLQGSVPSNNCYTKIQVLLSNGSFNNIVNGTGWTHTNNGSQSFTLNHNSGFVPAGSINPANFCVTGATLYTITVHYFYSSNGVQDTCSFNYTFDCPGLPNFCNCDSLTNQLTQFSANPGICCYDLEGEVPTSNCFTQIQVILSAGSFTNIQTGTGWNYVINNLQSIHLNHTSGFLPTGTITPASFCVTGATVYTITVHYFYNSGGAQDTCTYTYHFDCPNPPKICSCDSLITGISQTSALPGLCCHDMNAFIPDSVCYTQIQLQLSSGSFSNIQPATNWNVNINNAQSFDLTHNSGFIPSGAFNPVSFCVSGATVYSITVLYFFSNNGIKDTCTFKFNFDCPSVQDSLCDKSFCTSGNKTWQVIAGGLNFVYDMVVYQCKLIVAGQFTQVGTTAANNIAAWDGSTWTALGQGVNGPVRALAVHNGLLYAGGQFTTAGSLINVNNIAAWNGTTWSHLDNGVSATSGPAFVAALLSTSNGLVAGGQFQTAGLTPTLTTNNIAQWNGSTWNNNFNSLINVFNGPIYTLREYTGQLYAAGTFSTPQLNTAKYNGSIWTNNGNGINLVNNVPYNGVAAQYVYGGNLIVGGHFLNADNLPATQHIASWNGTNWLAIPGGDLPDTIDAVHDFIKFNNRLYAGGAISQMGSTILNGVGEWDGSNWNSTNHPPQIIWALEVYDSCGTKDCQLFSGGEGFVNRWVCITAVDKPEAIVDFVVQPNPAKNSIRIILNGHPPKGSILKLSDLQGKIVYSEKGIYSDKIEWDISGLPEGIYLLVLENGINAPKHKIFIKK